MKKQKMGTTVYYGLLAILMISIFMSGPNTNKIPADNSKSINRIPMDSLKKKIANPATYPGAETGEVFYEKISTTQYMRYDTKTGKFEEYDSEDEGVAQIHLDDIQFKTKRLGSIAYNSDGSVDPNALPIFVQRLELDSAIILLKTTKQDMFLPK